MGFFYLALSNFIIFTIYSYISYQNEYKEKEWFIPTLCVLSFITHVLWAFVAKRITDPNILYYYGFIWDALVMLPFVLVPILFFNINLSFLKILGIILVLSGLWFIRHSSF